MGIKKITKIMSIVLLFCFMVMEFSSVATVLADERNAKAAERKWMQDAGAGLVDWAGQYKELDENTVPKAVGYENAKWKNHIERLYDEEGKDLNRVVFKNADGTRTQYLFDYPVKYKDKDGKIKDSSLKIKENNSGKYKFETEAGVSTAMFPNSMQEGIVLEGNDTQIKMVLHNVKSDHPKRLDEETISYKYDAHTTVEYSLTYTGFKEDIVVHKYTGQTEYDFTIYTGGLELKEIDGSFYIVDENGEEKATIGDIIIFTADEKNNTLGELRAVEVVKNQEYRLTIVVDPEYLASPETVYPIRIDPTIEITYDNNGAGAIEDVTINSLKGSSGNSKSLSVGLREKYGISRILMKFPGLDLSQIGAHTKITNATVELRDLLCEGTYLTVSCHAFAGNEWTESTANWSNVSPNSISTFLSSQTISYYNGVDLSPKHRYSFDITEAVKGWKTGNFNQEKGIIFKAGPSVENGSAYDCRTIASYNRSSNKPTLTVTYDNSNSSYQAITDGTKIFNNKYSGNYLKYESASVKGQSGLLQNLGNSVQWEFKNVDGGYVIYSVTDNTKYLGVSSGTTGSAVEVVTIKDTEIPTRCIWNLTMASGGGGYLLKNNYNSKYLCTLGGNLYLDATTGTSTSYNARVWRMSGTSIAELGSGFSVNDIAFDIDDVVTPTINKYPTNAYWSTASDFTYTVSNTGYVTIDNYEHSLTANKSGTVVVTATHKVTGRTTTFDAKVNKNAIIIMHGFMGARLKTTEAYGIIPENATMWEPIDVLAVEKINALEFDKAGNPVCGSIEVLWGEKASENYDATIHFGALDTYQQLNLGLSDAFSDRYEIKFFQYDWRKSNIESAAALDQFVNENKYDKIVIVAHSMGGLVAANYFNIGEEQRAKVETFISLGTPYFGSVDMVYYMQLCRDIDNLLTLFQGIMGVAGKGNVAASIASTVAAYGQTITDVIYNIPAVYELVPNQHYYNIADRTYIKNCDFGEVQIKTMTSYTEGKAVLENKLYGYNSMLMQSAEEMHSSLFSDGEYITNKVNSYYIVGTNVSTMEYLTFDSIVLYTFNYLEKSNCGDGTVPTWSANLGGMYPDRTFYVENASHTEGLVQSENVLNKIIHIINGNPDSEISGITQTVPVYE